MEDIKKQFKTIVLTQVKDYPDLKTFYINMLKELIIQLESQPCNHDDVTQLKLNALQKQDGYTRYQCQTCFEDVPKSIEFNRLYQQHYNLCQHKNTFVYKNELGHNVCFQCGVEL
jgi:hypothetical protein